ncbi:MAG: hypothetical protein HY891_05510, partial [Deltaproteobacteria bacterium]|nr:hypothetical protein [Deltaproteobacteria bacterium]
SLPPSAFDITPTQNFLTADSLKGVAWEIVENTGGDGNIQVAHTAEGADCAGVPPTETIPVLAGQLSMVYTPFQPSTITTINGLLNGYGSFRVCFTVNNLSGSQPLNVRLRLKINSAGKVGVGM